jgi:hypothetical protein
MTPHALSRTTLGLPGLIGVLCLAAWLVGWTVLGLHDGPFHLLAPVGVFLILVQVVRRVDAPADD